MHAGNNLKNFRLKFSWICKKSKNSIDVWSKIYYLLVKKGVKLIYNIIFQQNLKFTASLQYVKRIRGF